MWEHKRSWVYRLIMIGIYLFPRRNKKIAFKITKLMFHFFLGIKNQQCSIVSTILAGIFIAYTDCQRGVKFFHGLNLILHLWAMKYFRRQLPASDSLPLIGYNWIVTKHKKVDRNNLLRSALDYLDFLRTLSNQRIR